MLPTFVGSATGVDKIRVLFGNHPEMIPDAIRKEVEGQPDMEIVADVRGPMKILQEVGRTKADAVILTQVGSEEPGLCSQLLAVYPDLTIITLAPDLESGSMQQLCARRRAIHGGNAQSGLIAKVLRQAVQEPCEK